jgi:hypothetical protein
MISSSTGDMPWLNQPNPGEFMLASQNSGANVARNFMQAFQNAQERKREDSLLPLRRQLLDNQIKAQAIGIETSLWKQQDMLTNKKAFSEMSKAAAEISASGAWAKPESEKRIWEIAAQYPSVQETQEFKFIASQFDKAAAAERMMKTADANIALRDKTIETLNRQKEEDRAARERMNSQDNQTQLELARLRVESKARDVLPDMVYREFSEIARAIASDTSIPNLAAKERKMDEALERAKEKAKLLETKKATGTNAAPSAGGMIQMTGRTL